MGQSLISIKIIKRLFNCKHTILTFLLLFTQYSALCASSSQERYAQLKITNFEEAKREGKSIGPTIANIEVRLMYSEAGYNPKIKIGSMVASGLSDSTGLVKLSFQESEGSNNFKRYTKDEEDRYHWLAIKRFPLMGEQVKQKPHKFLGKSKPNQDLGFWMNGAIQGLTSLKAENINDEITITLLNMDGEQVRQTRILPTVDATAEFILEDIAPGDGYQLVLEAANHHRCVQQNIRILPGDIFGVDEAKENRFEFVFELPPMAKNEPELRDYSPRIVPETGVLE